MDEATKIALEKDDAYNKALISLARYRFMLFGYYAAIWSRLNKMDTKQEPNPFGEIVKWARKTLS